MSHPSDLFESLRDFNESLNEVDLLCDAADRAQNDPRCSSVFNKAALLLIAGKFEAFAESIAEEFVFLVNDRALVATKVPEILRLHHTFFALRGLETLKNPQKQAEAIDIFRQLGALWISVDKSLKLKLDCKLAFGRHGETQFVRMFQQLGISDIFDSIVVNEPLDIFAVEHEVQTVDFRGTLNSVTAMRNNILHEDASPNLTTPEIRRFRTQFQSFADALALYLCELFQGYCAEVGDGN
jgi:hypothetical protein